MGYETKLPINYGIRFLLGIWILLIGTLLTTWYKSFYTMEMISPLKSTAPWKYVWDIPDFNMFFPLDETVGNVEGYGCGQDTYLNMHQFWSALARTAKNEGTSTKFRLFASLANHIMNGYKVNIIVSDILCRSIPAQNKSARSKGVDVPFLRRLL